MSNNKRKSLIEKGLSYCPKCDETKEVSEFNKDKHTAFGIAIYCKTCQKKKGRNRYITHKNEHRNNQLKNDFNITLEEYNKILDEQNGKCAICGNIKNGNRVMCVDHDHYTGHIRGLLCGRCNLGIGSFTDDIDLLKKAIIYLEKFKIK
ncbi:MAG: endonuclease VII domain-containing protein [Patescibacteria group bacterium]